MPHRLVGGLIIAQDGVYAWNFEEWPLRIGCCHWGAGSGGDAVFDSIIRQGVKHAWCG